MCPDFRSMTIFLVGQRGRLTLAGEVLSLYYEGLFDLVISQEVVEELLDVIREEFSDAYDRVLTFLAPFAPQFSRKPTPEEVTAALPYIVDLDDAPIFAAAVAARPGRAIVLFGGKNGAGKSTLFEA